MAKSITQKSSTEQFDIEKIKRFTQEELKNLAQVPSELPFCYQIGKDLLVGNYRINYINNDCWRVMHVDSQLFDFFNRKDAIYYCVALHKDQHNLAKDIRDCDALLNKLEFEAQLYRIRYKKAKKAQDSWGQEFATTKYKDIMLRIDLAREEIKKNIDIAKYIKV